jgi:hypothetical protein
MQRASRGDKEIMEFAKLTKKEGIKNITKEATGFGEN